MKNHCIVCKLIGVLAGIGALNWGLVSIFQFDLVATLLGPMSMASRVAYGLIGVSGLALLACTLIKACPCCSKAGCAPKA